MKIAGGAPLEEAILFANAAAAISVTKVGAQGGMPDRKEAENLLMGQGTPANKGLLSSWHLDCFL